MTQEICVINTSTLVSDADLALWCAAIQRQVNEHFSPAWGTPQVQIVMSAAPEVNAFRMILKDEPDDPNDLGFHIDDNGVPEARIFCRPTIVDGDTISAVMSHEICFTADTRIALLDGTNPPISELVGRDHFWVYSMDVDKHIVPGRAHSARLTRKSVPILAVALDNGEVIRCTPDHPFLTRDGAYVAAEDLIPGASLMSLYRELAPIDPGKKTSSKYEYERIFDIGANAWRWTHRMVAPICPEGSVRHHADFNRFNNSPDNLEIMEWEAHQQLHAAHIGYYAKLNKGKKRNMSLEGRARVAENGRKSLRAYNGSPEQRAALARYLAKPEVKKMLGDRLRLYTSSEANSQRMKDRMADPARKAQARAQITAYNKSVAHRDRARQLGRQNIKNTRTPEARAKRLQYCQSDEGRKVAARRGRYRSHISHHKNKGIQIEDCIYCMPYNHKVISVEPVGIEDVYDFTVDEYHNFALSAGVFVHNCEMLADPTCQRMFGNYIAETADPVQSTGYMIGDTYVSNFVLPAYFDPSSAGPWDFNHQLTGPVPNMLSGGYIEWWAGSQWQQTFARRADGSIPYQMLKAGGRSFYRATKGAPALAA